MPTKSEPQWSRRERQIMDILYRRGRAAAAEVLEEMPAPSISKTTVRTLLRILEEKGHLQHSQEGQTYVYRPKKPREKAGRSALQRVLHTFFGGSLERAVAAHLSDDVADLTDKELANLARLIQQARRKGNG